MIKKDEELKAAIKILQNDGIVGMPTETVYGLAGSIESDIALKKIFAVKERPFFDPLIVHVASIESATKLVKNWPHAAQVLAEAFWPGPLTLVLEKAPIVSDLITSGLNTVGIRMPKHEVALSLIRTLGIPLAAPSANKFGKTSPTTPQHVMDEFINEQIFVLDGGHCEIGVESTVLYINQLKNELEISILRAGNIVWSQIEKVLVQNNIQSHQIKISQTVSAPGQMKHHYMPKKPLIFLDNGIQLKSALPEIVDQLQKLPLIVESVEIIRPNKIKTWKELILSSHPEEAARELYSKLRLIADGPEDILFFQKQTWHQGEHWDAVLDRLGKASTLKIQI
jgi:L-threonylcarbamoyladenylate synthase